MAAAEITDAVQSACAQLDLTGVAVSPQLPAHWCPLERVQGAHGPRHLLVLVVE